MNTTRTAALALAALLAACASPRQPSGALERASYVGQQHRAVKALSGEEIRAYLTGEGMGYAKAAELNSYPGPRHALDLADRLALSAEQRTELLAVYEAMHADAVALGAEIVGREAALDSLFAQRSINEPRLNVAVEHIAALEGRLRTTHLSAHLTASRLLTPEQVIHYDRLRGYDGGHEHGSGNASPNSGR